MKSRRLPRLIVALAALTGFIAIPAQALGQEARDRPSSEIARLLRTGRDIDAVQFAKKSVETAPHSEWQSVFRLAAQTCITTMDADCARDVLNMVTPSLTSAQAFELQPSTRGYVILLGSFFQVMTEDYHAKLSGPGFPNPAVNPTTDPVLFAELDFLAAKQSRLLFDFEASRDYLDKALTITLSLQDKRFDASRLVVRIVAQLIENYDVERAVRLVAAAMPLLQTIPPDSFLAYEFLQVVGTLAVIARPLTSYRRHFIWNCRGWSICSLSQPSAHI